MYMNGQVIFDLKTKEPVEITEKWIIPQNPTTHLIWSQKGYKSLPKTTTHNSFLNHKQKRIFSLHDGIFYRDINKAKQFLNLGYIIPAALHPKEEQERIIKQNKERSIYNLKQQTKYLISAAKYTVESFIKRPTI